MPQSYLLAPPHCLVFTTEVSSCFFFFFFNDLKGFCFLIYRIKFTKLNSKRLVSSQSLCYVSCPVPRIQF